ncbi:MAG: hypothetical protein LBI45_07505 [Bacteroidales bacterium]|nr:hypothetical protein [Bacteroidales bacterium]
MKKEEEEKKYSSGGIDSVFDSLLDFNYANDQDTWYRQNEFKFTDDDGVVGGSVAQNTTAEAPAASPAQTTGTQQPSDTNMVIANKRIGNPSTSTTITRTDTSKISDYKDWNEIPTWDVLRRELGIREPIKPEQDADREKRLRRTAMWKSVGEGLVLLGEIGGLAKGASVRKRDIQEPKELELLEKERDMHQKELSEYNKHLKDYYKQASDHEIARRKAYFDSKTHGDKISTTTTSGGGYTTYENSKYELEKKKAGKSTSSSKSKQITGRYPIGDGSSYSWSYLKEHLPAAANVAREKISIISGIIPKEYMDIIESSLHKDGLKPIKDRRGKTIGYEKYDVFNNKVSWTESDNEVFLKVVTQKIINHLKNIEKKQSQTDKDIEDKKMLGEILRDLTIAGFNYDY